MRAEGEQRSDPGPRLSRLRLHSSGDLRGEVTWVPAFAGMTLG
jgi:hypothetical protein